MVSFIPNTIGMVSYDDAQYNLLLSRRKPAVAGLVDAAQLKRVIFRSDLATRIKDLKGFSKGHTLPVGRSTSTRRFIHRIAEEDLKADIEQTYQRMREHLGFKRRQLEASVEDGAGVIRTPKFSYSIKVLTDSDTDERVVWRRELSGFRDPQLLRGTEFQKAFGKLFSSLVFEFRKTISVANLIDALEEEDRPGVQVKCASDASWGEIAIKGPRGTIRIEPKSLTISGGQNSNAVSLLDLFMAFMQNVPTGRKWPALR